jgi:arylsulfatase A-like enzyme
MRPNIILILMDDMGWRDLGCYGSSFYETPNLDRLAQQGMRFTDAYAACPVCSPTRASMMTGRYPARVGVTNFIAGCSKGALLEAPYIKHLPLTEKSIASALQSDGYATWHIGKWHLGGEEFWPLNHGFDVNIAGCHQGHPKSYFSPYQCPTLPDGSAGEYLTDRLTDEAIHLIRNNKQKPFFLNFWHYAVHNPIQAPQHLIEKYENKARALGLDKLNPFVEGEHFPCEHKKHLRIKRRMLQSDPRYAAMIENLDWNFGRLMQTLEDTGQAENTIVMFTSDNGGLSTAESSPTCNAPLQEGKGWMYEGGTREPLIIKWPGQIRPGAICQTPITTPDFYPTILSMAQLDPLPQQHCDGESLLPILTERGELKRDAIFWHYPHYGNQGGTPGASIRCGDYKLIEFFEGNRVELYDLREDISESHDLAAAQPQKAAELRTRLQAWLQSVDARLPTPNPDWVPATAEAPATSAAIKS